MSELKKIKTLFLTNFYLSAFTFGGGYVIITLMKEKYVDQLGWIDEAEMLDLVAIAQSAPGAIAVNGAIVVGFKIAGVKGVIVSIIATILPPFLIILGVSFFYDLFKNNPIVSQLLKGMQIGVGAVIVAVVLDMAKAIIAQKEILLVLIMLGAFIANYFFKVNVSYIILFCGLIGVLQNFRKRGQEK